MIGLKMTFLDKTIASSFLALNSNKNADETVLIKTTI